MASRIVYIARDIERALGKEPIGDYFIITNESPYSLEMKKKYTENIYLIKKDEILDTYEILILPEVEEIINKLKAEIIVFKNTIHIEKFCKEKEWILLNPSAELGEKIENKISQISWLDELASLLPPHSISIIKNVKWENKPFILQWSHGHTGEGTILIKNENELKVFQEKFPHREARITDFIKGPMFTINIVVTKDSILLGNISYQITGILPFTENPFSTIGNDWSLPHTILSEKQIEQFRNIAETIAKKMREDGWIGLFGIDIVYDEKRDMLYLIEINARQPASTTYESELQNIIRKNDVRGINIFEAHISSLLNLPIKESIIPINDGAQILQRVTKKIMNIDIQEIINARFKVIKYSNTKPNADLFRIQSERGIMETHNKFNKEGKKILEIVLEP
ncbi:MAG: ATP-grasp domain-containing protein [Patescibacteria group bacterium]